MVRIWKNSHDHFNQCRKSILENSTLIYDKNSQKNKNGGMDLESIMLIEMSHKERQTPYDFTYMWNLKINKQTKQKQICWY